MNDRKQHVIRMAHELFMEKGFQATSIQDILEYSGISKGTFYNYFSSKNELLIALFKVIYKKLEQERNELLIGQDPSNIEIFIKQIEIQMKTNRTNKLMALFEEVFFSKDEELKEFIKQSHLKWIRWIYLRFIDIFGEEKRPFLLDCTVMFMGILNHNVKYNAMSNESNASIYQIVRYSVERVVHMVNEVSQKGEQLIRPELLEKWLPENKNCDHAFQKELYLTVLDLKKTISHIDEQAKYLELLDFIQDELLDSKSPRKFLIKTTLQTLNSTEVFIENKVFEKLYTLVLDYLKLR
jgi:AcrR family transcriptional regulator